MSVLPVTISDVRAAAARIASHVHRTPVLTSSFVDAAVAAAVFFKCENLQKVGAFKARGAVNATLLLSEETASRGVVTHSSGNHGAALAYAASIRGVPCWVVMPDDVNPVKVSAVRSYGATVVFCEQSEREAEAGRVAGETGAALIHPYDDAHVIAGQGTATLELTEDVAGIDLLVAPVGGGGLLSGAAVVMSSLPDNGRVIGAEPEAVDDAYRSLREGVLLPAVENPHTVADGLLTGLGELPFAILLATGARVVTVPEVDILAAARLHLERMKLVVEPSAATALAALLSIGPELAGLRIGVILSGGNTDFRWLTADR